VPGLLQVFNAPANLIDAPNVKWQYAYARFLNGFGLFTNFALFNCFLTCIYNFRTTELFDTRRMPFLVKFTISSASAFYKCNKLWHNNIYEADLY
jgi:hypothetical protein